MKIRALLALTAMLLATVGVGAAGAERETKTQRVNFAIGCQQADDGTTCETTEYFLSTGTGDNNVGSTLDFTPLGWAFFQLDGEYTTTPFTSDATLRDETFELIGGTTIEGQIAVAGFVSGAEVGVDSAVFVELKARDAANKPVKLGEAEITKIVSSPIDSTYEFSFDVDEDLDGVVIGSLSAEVAQRHITVLQNGFMNGTGESFFEFDYLVPAVPQVP